MMQKWIDLHIHLDGSLPYEAVHKIMKLENMPEQTDRDLMPLLSVPENCKDLNEYLAKFDFPLSLMQTRESIRLSMYELLTLQKQQGLLYTEIRFAPQSHRKKGLCMEDAVQAAVAGMEDFLSEQEENDTALHAGIILCAMRGAGNEAENRETADLVNKYRDKGVVALDLAGAEALFKTESFAPLFSYARSLDIPFTIHAGEADGPDSIRAAVRFGAGRIGHGVRCMEEEALVEELADRNIALECCPTSNLHTKVFTDMREYPIRRMLERGMKVTVNTDNMTVSGTTEQDEFQKLEKALALTAAEEQQMLRNSVESIFGGEEEKARLRSLFFREAGTYGKK